MSLRDETSSTFSQRKTYWKARSGLRQLRFVCFRALFGARIRARETRIFTSSFGALVRVSLFDVVVGIGLAVALQVVSLHIGRWSHKHGFLVEDAGIYGALLGAVAGMGGLFIGLYYAAVSTVASSIYQSVPNDIRGLLARDRLGTSYMRFLAVLTYSEVCLFAFLVAGIAPAILAIPLVVIGAGFTIVGFIRLGARAFNLFDPTALSDRLLGDLRQAFESVQAGRFRWSDPSFQNHARRLAENSIDSITVVAELTEKAEHLSGRPYISLSRRIISFLVEYEAARKTIPTESLWHAETFVHSGWYVAADSNTTLGHNTSTMLQPKPTRNRRWIEASLMKPIFQCLDVNMRSNRYGMLNELLRHTVVLCEDYRDRT